MSLSERLGWNPEFRRSFRDLVAERGDFELARNQHLPDYDKVLGRSLYAWLGTLSYKGSSNSRVDASAGAKAEIMAPEIVWLCGLVNRMHALDVGPHEIANRKFAGKLVSMADQAYSELNPPPL